MTDRGALPPKLYFRIGEVAGLVGVEPHVLRYWEREFRTIRPSKSAKGQRVYSRRDVENLLRVRELLYGQGFTIAGARRRLRDRDGAGAEEDDAAPRVAVPRSSPAAEVVAAVPLIIEAPLRSSRVRTEIEALKAEVEGFLAELGAAP